MSIRLFWVFGCLALLAGCSLVDRQGAPELLDLTTDRGNDPAVGRGQEVKITIITDDPDNDELDFRWIASGGTFTATRRDTFVDLFQDSVSVTWKAPIVTGVYELFLEVSDGKSETVTTSSLRISVTQVPPTALVQIDPFFEYNDSLRIVLDGTGSVDPDGDELTYVWRQLGGPRVSLENISSASPSFQALAPADYVFELQVADIVEGVGDSSNVVQVRLRVNDRGGVIPGS
ncbi:MAG: hypothetical protein HOE48_18680 [Candidatus Latescibacteria bacterium]|nr:hypothetical protein [Candidatus Latescibacterota bacterium]MBT4139950.1 hypothetical protein [Candidatus Latescibacterota bacterium]MBT5832468.1 hypothetical protein [Candidatus Latescibacterota bacterium]